MVYESSVIYPKTPTSTFDMDYYIKTHMPLVAENWGKFGLQGYKVIQFNDHPGDGTTPAFSVKCDLFWKDKDSVAKATTSKEADTVFGDVPNLREGGGGCLATAATAWPGQPGMPRIQHLMRLGGPKTNEIPTINSQSQ